MGWLHQVKDAVEQEIFGQVANLLNEGQASAIDSLPAQTG
jgi:hypothetical protein